MKIFHFWKSTEKLKTLFMMLSLLSLLFLMSGQVPVAQASGISATSQPSLDFASCHPGEGWQWITGPSQPEAARKAELALKENGFETAVTAIAFGEKDSCGNFEQFSTDFTVTLKNTFTQRLLPSTQSYLANRIHDLLLGFGTHQLGNVRIDFGFGETKFFPGSANSPVKLMQTSAIPGPSLRSDATFKKKVFLLVYNPLLSNGQDLITYMKWTPYTTLVQGIIDSFQSASQGHLQYTIVDTQVVANEWPEKIDGFRYTEATYLSVMQNQTPHHDPDTINYDAIMDNEQFDICGKLNSGEIDEVWVYGGPWFGLYESRLLGPGAYWFNSPPMTDTHNCNKLVPVMGLSYERGVAEAVHSFGHRAESTMTKVYGGWDENTIAHNWDRFGLVKAQSPNFSYSGCGSVHYPPNGTSGYDYGNHGTVLTNCDDFNNYPDLSDPLSAAKPVDCTEWNCEQIDYLVYWFSHLPANAECGSDTVANNWWFYFSDVNFSLNPTLPCQPFVTSITRADPNSTNAASVNFTVAFSESLTGVAMSNFSLTTTGVTGTSITGISGSGAERIVTVSTGTGSGTIRLDMMNSTDITDVDGNPINNLPYTLGDIYSIRPVISKVFRSLDNYDGWVLESSETSNNGGTMNQTATLLYIGDDSQDKQYRSFLSFNTAGLPDGAVITEVKLKIKVQGFVGGNMFTPTQILGSLLMDISSPYFGSNADLVVGDFRARAGKNKVGVLDSVTGTGWQTVILNDTAYPHLMAGTTQFRLRFAKDDNDDQSNDYLRIYSGNAPAASRPKLIVTYYVQ